MCYTINRLFMKKIVLGEKFNNQKFDFRETCFGICVNEGKILLTHKTNKNEIALPGGGIENNETHLACLKREFQEETGYAIDCVEEFITIDCYWLAGGKWPMQSLANVYIVKVKKNSNPTEEFCQPKWVDINTATDLLQLPYQKKALEIYLNNNFYNTTI